MNKTLARVAILAAMLDLAVKLAFPLRDGALLHGLLAIHQTSNTGAAFGLLSGQGGLSLILSALLLALAGYFAQEQPLGCLQQTGAGLLLGGALGNLLDRLVHGAVSDYLKLLFVRFPIFNLADVFITLGAGLLVVSLLFFERRGEHGQHPAQG